MVTAGDPIWIKPHSSGRSVQAYVLWRSKDDVHGWEIDYIGEVGMPAHIFPKLGVIGEAVQSGWESRSLSVRLPSTHNA